MSQDRLLNGNDDSALKHNKQRSSIKGDSTLAFSNSLTIANETIKSNVPEIDLTKTPIQVKILYGTNANEQRTTPHASVQRRTENAGSALNKCDINENCTPNDSLIKGQTLLTSFFRPIAANSKKTSIDIGDDGARNNTINNDDDYHDDDDDDEYDNPLEIDYAPTSESIASDCEKTDRTCLLLHRKRIRRKYNRISTVRQKAVDLLVHLARTIRTQFTTNWHRFRNKHVLFVYQCISFYHRFAREFVKQSKSSETATTTTTTKKLKMTTEAITINRRVQKLLNDHTNAKETSDDAVVTTATTPNHSGDGGAKRPPKSQRSSDNSRLLLLTENAHESSEKDFGMYQWV